MYLTLSKQKKLAIYSPRQKSKVWSKASELPEILVINSFQDPTLDLESESFHTIAMSMEERSSPH